MKNLSISVKLAAAVGVGALFMVVGVGVSYRQSTALAEALQTTSARLESLLSLTEARIDVSSLTDIVRAADEVDSGLDLQRYGGTRERVFKHLKLLAKREAHNELGAAALRVHGEVAKVDARIRLLLQAPEGEDVGIGYLNAAAELFALGSELRAVEAREREVLSGGIAGVSQLSANPVRLIVLSLIITMTLAIAAVLIVSRRYVVLPLRQLTHVSRRIVESGDLQQRVGIEGRDEVGQLAETLQQVLDKMRAVPFSLEGLVTQLADVVGEVGRVLAAVTEGAAAVGAEAARSRRLLDEVSGAVQRTGDGVNALRTQVDASGSANSAQQGRTEEVTQAAQQMAQTSGELQSAAQRLAGSVEAVAASVQLLDESIAQTSQALAEIDAEAGSVGTRAAQTRELAASTAAEAETGSRAMQKAMVGVEEIKAASGDVARVVSQLGNRMGAISSIVAVISDVAEQTNLLSLNAAIIAAQAGEEGRGFAVVADEVKALAERTHESVQEISQAVSAIEADARDAVAAAGRTVDSVERGIVVSRDANDAFSRILESAHHTSGMVDAIASSASVQADRSRRVSDAMTRIDDVGRSISASTAGQAGEAQRLRRVASDVADAATAVQTATHAQADGASAIGVAITAVHDAATEIDGAQSSQAESATRLRAAVGEINAVASRQSERVDELARALDRLQVQAAALSDTVRQFRY